MSARERERAGRDNGPAKRLGLPPAEQGKWPAGRKTRERKKFSLF